MVYTSTAAERQISDIRSEPVCRRLVLVYSIDTTDATILSTLRSSNRVHEITLALERNPAASFNTFPNHHSQNHGTRHSRNTFST